VGKTAPLRWIVLLEFLYSVGGVSAFSGATWTRVDEDQKPIEGLTIAPDLPVVSAPAGSETPIAARLSGTFTSNLNRLLRKRRGEDERRATVNGSIANFTERLSWDRIAELTDRHVIRLVDAVRPRALNPRHALHAFLMERLVELRIERTADDSGIEYILRFQDDLTLTQRVPWKNCSDIFDP
jgi:hypothetical protein